MIKLALLESDQNFMNRIKDDLAERFSDKLEVYTFLDLELAMYGLDTYKINVLLSSAAFEVDIKAIPATCGFAYFVDYPHIKTHNGQKVICRFQKPELIFNEIESIYQQVAGVPLVSPEDGGGADVKTIAFVSASGGVGSSVMSAACAAAMAHVGRSVLYLNIEQFGSANTFFIGNGQYGFGDVIAAVKSKEPALPLKLKNMVKRDNDSGVCFYDASHSPSDLTEMTNDHFALLFSALKGADYSHIIMDMDFSLSQMCLERLQNAGMIIFISDGSEVANLKFLRAFGALMYFDQKNNTDLCRRISLMYNRFSSKTSSMIEGVDLSVLGGAPRYERATIKQIMKQLAGMPLFNGLM